MSNRTYYGEYTLIHWIKLMLTGNIVLPEYQRRFVWQERDVKRLIQSLKEGQFVQPVTIALYNDGTKKMNLILDGQQRLTSLLLAYLGYFPDKKKFEEGSADVIASEDDSASDETEISQKGIIWRFPELLKLGNTKISILNKIGEDTKYKRLSGELFTSLDESFFEKTCMGFSYIVPETTDATTIQTSFSKLFRNINYFGKKLDALESRKSLYYQNARYTKYFDGKCEDDSEVLGTLSILENLQPHKIDFVRYLAMLSQFYVSDREDAKDIMVGYSAYSSRESYYADYVCYLLGIEQEDRVDKFNEFKFERCFPSDAWKQRFETLKETLQRIRPIMDLKDGRSFGTWFEADYWLFGLFYVILFAGKSLKEDLTRVDDEGNTITLSDEIKMKIKGYKDNSYLQKNANRLGYVRIRLVESYNIFCQYVQE